LQRRSQPANHILSLDTVAKSTRAQNTGALLVLLALACAAACASAAPGVPRRLLAADGQPRVPVWRQSFVKSKKAGYAYPVAGYSPGYGYSAIYPATGAPAIVAAPQATVAVPQQTSVLAVPAAAPADAPVAATAAGKFAMPGSYVPGFFNPTHGH
jgi:hypothetical protein